jgi:DME family drug/metabolite transporter
VVKVLFLEAVGGVVIWIALAIWGRPPGCRHRLPHGVAAGTRRGLRHAANLLFFGAMKRIEAAPASVAATIEPVIGALLALLLFSQRLTALGWLGLVMVVGGVAAGYCWKG